MVSENDGNRKLILHQTFNGIKKTMKPSHHSSRIYPYESIRPEGITVRAPYRDGWRMDWVDRIFSAVYPISGLYTILRIVQFDHLEYFLAVEALNILTTVIGTRLFCFWWVWKTLTVIFTPSKLILRVGWRSFVFDAKGPYGFSSMPHQDREYRQSRTLKQTFHILLEHSQGTVPLGNVFGELVARQIVSKLQGLQAWTKTLKVEDNSGR